MSVQPACIGQPLLFEATDLASHAQAASICAGCQAIEWCRELARETAEVCYYGGLHGTWHGELFGANGIRSDRLPVAELDLMYDAESARKAHARYAAGQRDKWTVDGNRIYNTRRKRQKKLKEAS